MTPGSTQVPALHTSWPSQSASASQVTHTGVAPASLQNGVASEQPQSRRPAALSSSQATHSSSASVAALPVAHTGRPVVQPESMVPARRSSIHATQLPVSTSHAWPAPQSAASLHSTHAPPGTFSLQFGDKLEQPSSAAASLGSVSAHTTHARMTVLPPPEMMPCSTHSGVSSSQPVSSSG